LLSPFDPAGRISKSGFPKEAKHNMRTFLVTGGAGFIGSNIVEALVERGDKVRVLDNFCAGFEHNLAAFADDVEIIDGDVTDFADVERAVKGVDCVFHHAALASVPLSVERPLASNHACVTGTLTVLDAARRGGVRRVVYAASSSAYGDSTKPAKQETDLPRPLSPYAVAKLAGEQYCQAFYHTYGFETVALRYFNIFGPRQDPNSPYSAVIPLFITQLLSGQSPVIFGDGTQTRDFCFVKNVAHANLLAADAADAPGKVINIADGRSTSLIELIGGLNELLGTSVEPKFEPVRAGDVKDSLADISLAQEVLKYEPLVNFRDGLEQSIEYYKSITAAT
jgi:UDP-glucose 4-epimerase